MVAKVYHNCAIQTRRGRPGKLESILDNCPEVYQRMLKLIRAGAFACGAAQAMGIAPETFSRWLSRGRREQDGIYRQFRQDVLRAQAEARVVAEIQVYRENPLAWLRFGPGRSRPGEPGWTDGQSEVQEPDGSQPRRPVMSQEAEAMERGTTLGEFLSTLEKYGYAILSPTGRDLARQSSIVSQ